jgi:uroporphyrinogen-III synthase
VIGPITAAAARAAGLAVDVVARQYTVEGLLQAIVEYYDNLKEVE